MSKEREKPVVESVEAHNAATAGTLNVAGDLIQYAHAPQPPDSPGPPPTLRRLPPKSEKFAGRLRELAELHERLSRSPAVGVTQETAVHGEGGIGKTSLAIEYAWQHLEDYPGGAYLLPCDTDLLLPAMVDLAEPLGLSSEDDQQRIAARVKTQLESGPPALLILDNVRDARQLGDAQWSRYLPAGNCRRLITTRADRLTGVDMYRLDRLSVGDGIALLARHREDAGAADRRGMMGELVDWFDGLAVGLTVVGVYMEMQPGLSWEKYFGSLQDRGLDAVRDTEAHVETLPEQYAQRVDAVIDDLHAALPDAERRALDYAALLPEDNIVPHWLDALLSGDGVELPALPGYEDQPARAVIEELKRRYLLRAAGDDGELLSLHRVLRRRLRELLSEGDVAALFEQIEALAEERGKASHAALTDKSLRGELAPLLALSGALLEEGRTESAASLANWVHMPLQALGRYAEGRRSLSPFVDLPDSELTPQARAIASSYLATVLKDLGELPEARRRIERAIKILERHLDADHPTLATSYSNLAMILRGLGELPEARRRMERAIEIWEKHFDADHPMLATGYSNLATILNSLEELPEARRRMERAIEIWEQHFDADHPTLATSYSNLAMILRDLGELPEARRRMERAIEIEEKHFDADHPTLATSYNNLAYIELEEGNREAACGLWRRAHAIQTKHFDADHPPVQVVVQALQKHCGGVSGE